MKVIDVEQVYLGYAVHWSTGNPVTDHHTEIEMGAEESESGRVIIRCGGTKKRKEAVEAGADVDEEVNRTEQEGQLGQDSKVYKKDDTVY